MSIDLYEQHNINPSTGKVSQSNNYWPDPKQFAKELQSPEMINEMLGAMIGGPGFQQLGKTAYGLAKPVVERSIEYFHPERKAEEFRRSLGEGSTKENLSELGKRVQFAKKSAVEESLIPKREIYAQEGKSHLYNVKPENIPEGNIERFAGMFEPGQKFTENQIGDLTETLKNFRKGKLNEGSFLEEAENIFGIENLPKSSLSKIEDALSLPTKRESKYLSDEDVLRFYSKNGKIKELHDKFAKKPTLNNYDALQSALKKEERTLASRDKKGSLGDLGSQKLEVIRNNISNLNSDVSSFMSTLPEQLQALEKEFRTKYAKGVAKYENAPLTIRQLAEGNFDQADWSKLERIFTRPTKEVKEILNDLGPSAGRQIIYNALQKVPLNDSKKMAETVLDLKRTKGYDQFITPEMEKWAHQMLKHVSTAEKLKLGLKGIGGAAAGGLLTGGPIGAGIGALGATLGPKAYGKAAEFLRKRK